MVEKFPNLNLKDDRYIFLVILTLIFFKTANTLEMEIEAPPLKDQSIL